MYTDHSDWKDGAYGESDPFSPDGEKISVTKNTDLVGREYERQQAAWKKVEQCKSDGGSDCMKYSATNTADKADGKDGGRTVLPDTGGSKLLGVPLWVWLATGGVGIAVVIGGIVLAVVLSKRGRRRSRHGGHAAGRGPLPPVNPYPPQVPGANNGMVPPPAAGQYAPQQQVPYPTAFPQQYGQGQPVPQYRVPSQTPQASTQRAPYSAAPVAMPPQQAAQPTVIPDNTQNPHTNNNR